jgi:hypothetical protein
MRRRLLAFLGGGRCGLVVRLPGAAAQPGAGAALFPVGGGQGDRDPGVPPPAGGAAPPASTAPPTAHRPCAARGAEPPAPTGALQRVGGRSCASRPPGSWPATSSPSTRSSCSAYRGCSSSTSAADGSTGPASPLTRRGGGLPSRPATWSPSSTTRPPRSSSCSATGTPSSARHSTTSGAGPGPRSSAHRCRHPTPTPSPNGGSGACAESVLTSCCSSAAGSLLVCWGSMWSTTTGTVPTAALSHGARAVGAWGAEGRTDPWRLAPARPARWTDPRV